MTATTTPAARAGRRAHHRPDHRLLDRMVHIDLDALYRVE